MAKNRAADFILGAQKLGQRLHYFLATHPKITMGDQQEMHFFDDDAMFAARLITNSYTRLSAACSIDQRRRLHASYMT
jgi:hypothetical protein